VQLEGIISERSGLTPIELRIRHLLRNEESVSPQVVPILLKLYEWTASIQDRISNCTPAETNPVSFVIQQIAENFTGTLKIAPGAQHGLVSKSLQEALFYSVDLNADLSAIELKVRLERLVDQENRVAFLRRFLSLYFFNYVWFHAEQFFRDQAVSPESFEEDLERVDELCQQAVSSAFSLYAPGQFVLDQLMAEELIGDIEVRIRGI
jgi:hypothetical protein